MSDTFGCFE